MRALSLAGVAAAVAGAAVALAGFYVPPPADVHPVWSPDGTRIAYFRFGDGLRVVGADGSGDRALPGLPLTPYFDLSRDWKRVALVVFQNSPNAFDLEVAGLDGGGKRVLAPSVAGAQPAFSPDGARVAYNGADGLWVVGVDGSGRTRVSLDTGTDLAWSPDGGRIAYTVAVGAGSQVEIARADGSGIVDRKPDPAWQPAWSPDGRTLAYLGDSEIHVGSAVYETRGAKPGDLGWAPDGRSVYYAAGTIHRIVLADGRREVVGPGSSGFALAPDGVDYAYAAIGICGDRAGLYVDTRRVTSDCHVFGTDGPDRLTSSGLLYEIVDGRGGDDVITGLGGYPLGDVLLGGPGNDRVTGGSLPDRIDGGPGNDALHGGTNRDVLVGGPGRDRLDGDGGSDRIEARDGERDVVDCGSNTGRTNKTPERDVAVVDRVDVVRRCERVVRSR